MTYLPLSYDLFIFWSETQTREQVTAMLTDHSEPCPITRYLGQMSAALLNLALGVLFAMPSADMPRAD